MGETDDFLKLSIAEAASGTTYVERRRTFQGRSAIHLGQALRAHPNGPAFSGVGGTGSIRVFTLEGVVLDGATLLLTKNGRVIRETAYFVSDQLEEIDPTDEPLSSDQVLIIASNNRHWGYHHWLTQCVPAIDWSLHHIRNSSTHISDRNIVLMLPELLPFQEQYLRLLGCAELPRLTPEAGRRYRLPRVVFCDFVNGSASFEVTTSLLQTVGRINDAVAATAPTSKRLYVSDVHTYYGQMRNESAAIALLRQSDFRIVDPTGLGVTERVSLFRNAEVVAGAMGQWLTDCLFCRPGGLLWEWMPAHHQNATFNRLAQTAGLDYWGDLFPTAAGTDGWDIDLGCLEQRLSQLNGRPAPTESMSVNAISFTSDPPLEEVMLRFESLGDRCEFGFVQRAAGVEPLGLLRFTGMPINSKQRLPRLVAALEGKFEGLGSLQHIKLTTDGGDYMVCEQAYDLLYHTWVPESEATPDVQRAREVKRLTFLRRKLLEDLASGEKVCVWTSDGTTTASEVRPLLKTLRGMGPNKLLWVTLADADHAPGTVELIEPHFMRGYVERYASPNHAYDIHRPSWFAVCQAALQMSSQTLARPGTSNDYVA